MKKRVLAILMTFAMLFSLLPATALAAENEGTSSAVEVGTYDALVTALANGDNTLTGTGTEEDPYLINNLEDLKAFRNTVNTYKSDGSNQYKGKYVKLTADIDLDEDGDGFGEAWEPIGTNSVGDHMAFLGTFDGDGHTISNLYVNSDGDHLGFFARVGSYAEGQTPTVKNITFQNVDVSSNTTNSHNGSYVGGVIANAGGNSVVSNVTVTGDVYVTGYGYVGGIIGHGYPDIDNCHVTANDGSWVHAHYWCAGGIIGYAGEGGTPITNCSVSGLDVWSAYGAAAAVAGLLQDGNTLTNVSASNVEVTSNSDYCMGYIAGNGEASTLTNVTMTDVTATANGKVITATDAVAEVDGTVYFDLQAAVDAADGKTVTLLRDVSINDTVKIETGKTITLELNGKVIDGTESCNIAVMSYGDLTIKDSSEAQTGTIKAGKTSGKSGNTINVCAGTFTLESGSIYSVNNALLIDEQAAVINIKGGTITAEPTTQNSAALYISSTSETTVNISDGTIVGYNGILLWNNTTLNMTGGSIDAKGSVGIMGNGNNDNTDINISGDASVAGYYAAIYHPQAGELNIADDATLTGWTGVVVKGGDITISGGTISGTGEANTYAPVSSGFIDTGDGLYVEHYDNSTNSENYGTPTVTITGGTFKSTNASAVASYANTSNSVAALDKFISGGSYSSDVSALCIEGYTAVGYQGIWEIIVAPQVEDQMVAQVNGGIKYMSLEAALAAAEDGDTVKILKAGTYELSTSGKDITITGSVDGVVFDNIGAKNMGGANVTFNNVTFDYYPNVNYTGLQHSGNLTYNNCIINGQLFLYGTSETFNNCTFNQDSADAYNVWTYGAKTVAFNECTFNSAGKSVLVYNEGACATDLTVTDTDFIASAPVEGKAAIEIDTTLMPDGTDIVVDEKTTASGFGTGSVSGNSLWNDKKDQTDLTITVADEQVWPIAVAQIGDQKFYSLQDAVNAAADNEAVTITLLTDTSEAARIDIGSKKDITIVGQVNGEGEYPAFTGWFKVTGKLTLKDVTLVAPSTVVPGETTSQYTRTVIGLMNTGDVVCENVTFDMSNAVADSTAITAWWSTGDGANITVTDCTFNCAGQRPIRSDACVTVERCTFNDPYRYAVQMTSKSSTMDADAEAYVVFNNNTIVDGENGKEYVYGVQLEGGYGCSDLTITGTGNTITADENDGSTLYFVENTDEMGFETIQWKTESAPALENSTFAAKIAGTDGDVYLPTLAEAIEIVAADGTVTLVANSSEEIEVSKALTIELNGFTAEKVTPADGYAVVKYETAWVFGAADSVVPVTGVTLSGATSVNVGNTITLTATVAPDNATDKTVTWTSSNESVATVADGVVTGVAAGTATITVTTADGDFTADCTVTVSRASSGGGSYNPSYTITAEETENGSITVSPSRASSGSTVTITVDPDSGYELDELTVLDKNGKEVELTKKSDGKYTFKMPSGKVTIEATFAEIGSEYENPFVDVAEGTYYYDAVLWAVENDITNGTSATTFSPDAVCTRAQVVTFLWRASGSPEPASDEMPFTDVAADAYYYDAVLWAVENGITNGISATTFSPDADCTRAQIVTFLWRSQGSEDAAAYNPFVDVESDAYYTEAVLWAVEEAITNGTSATTFSPDADCTRAQIVTFLWRCLTK